MAGRRNGLVHKKPAPKAEVVGEINITPLADVCLVLLIIFMVVTPLLARGKEVPLPKTVNHTEEKDKSQPIVAIDKKGLVYFDKDIVAKLVPKPGTSRNGVAEFELDKTEVLGKRIADTLDKNYKAWQADPDPKKAPFQRKVVLKADSDLTYSHLYPVIFELNNSDLKGIDLATNEQKQKAGN